METAFEWVMLSAGVALIALPAMVWFVIMAAGIAWGQAKRATAAEDAVRSLNRKLADLEAIRGRENFRMIVGEHTVEVDRLLGLIRVDDLAYSVSLLSGDLVTRADEWVQIYRVGDTLQVRSLVGSALPNAVTLPEPEGDRPNWSGQLYNVPSEEIAARILKGDELLLAADVLFRFHRGEGPFAKTDARRIGELICRVRNAVVQAAETFRFYQGEHEIKAAEAGTDDEADSRVKKAVRNREEADALEAFLRYPETGPDLARIHPDEAHGDGA